MSPVGPETKFPVIHLWKLCDAGLCKFRETDSQRETLLLGDTARDPLNYMIRLLPAFCRFFRQIAQQTRKVTVPWQPEVIDFDHQEAAVTPWKQ